MRGAMSNEQRAMSTIRSAWGSRSSHSLNDAVMMRQRLVRALGVVCIAFGVVELLTMAIWQPSAVDLWKTAAFLAASGLLSLGVMGVGLWLMLAGVLQTIRARIIGALVAGSVVALD